MRDIRSVNLDVTTCCDRRCPECCCAIGVRPTLHHNWQYFEQAAKVLAGLRRIHLTGGEPTTHPQFAEMVPRFKTLFHCEMLTLGTDGFLVKKHEGVLHHFDEIYFSDYGDNREIGVWLSSRYKTLIHREAHIPRVKIGLGGVCERGISDTVAYANGRVYGCCVGPGIDHAIGILPLADWKERVQTLSLPCKNCWFSI